MKIFIKNGIECYLCASRKKLIQITPEEEVRQNFIQKLIHEYGVPPNLIAVEVPLARFPGGKGKRGRADIVVSGIDKETYEKYPLIVIECKAPQIPLIDKVFDQVKNYDICIEPKIMVMTNGDNKDCFQWDEEKEDYLDIKDIPNFRDLVKGEGIELLEEIEDNFVRPNHKADVELNREFLLSRVNMGEDTDNSLVPLLANLTGLIYDDSKLIDNLPISEKVFKEDGGIRYTSFGNSAGGGWTGDYRYFIVENNDKETEIVSIALMGKISAKNHPKYGNSNGYSIFCIAIDDYENSHLSLQYSIDKHIKVELDKFSFWHDGTLTVGNLGRAKNKDVVDFIKLESPHLIKDDKIYLGTLDNSVPFRWGNDDVKKLVANFIDYGFARDKFRQIRKQAST